MKQVNPPTAEFRICRTLTLISITLTAQEGCALRMANEVIYYENHEGVA